MEHKDWLVIEHLEDYLEGKLNHDDMYLVERLSLEDPFVAEALEGLRLSKSRTQAVSLLQKQLQQRIAEKPVVRQRWRITSHRLSIAATAAVLFVSASILFWMRDARKNPVSPQSVTVTTAATVSASAVPVDAASQGAASLALPEGGWEKFELYLLENNKLLKGREASGNTVTVGFKIDAGGKAGNIRVLKSGGAYQPIPAEEKEAIRLIAAGPLWQIPATGNEGNRQMQVNIGF